MVTEEQYRLLKLCAVRRDGHGIDWHLVARLAQRPGGLEALYRGEVWERSPVGRAAVELLTGGLDGLDEAAARVDGELDAAQRVGARLITVLDDEYPANLRLIAKLPPFLFVCGRLQPSDARAVAVVGTRRPAAAGLAGARRIAGDLARADVTVASGLARGIDTAAHEATLDAGGRTIAVLGTGITRCYPPENADLAQRVARSGALVSQFWPTAPPTKASFPRRNHVTSGITQGTVVVEATATSGARMQARFALEQGKQVFLAASLVTGRTSQPWARRYVSDRGAIEIERVEDVLALLADADRIKDATEQRRQLALFT